MWLWRLAVASLFLAALTFMIVVYTQNEENDVPLRLPLPAGGIAAESAAWIHSVPTPS